MLARLVTRRWASSEALARWNCFTRFRLGLALNVSVSQALVVCSMPFTDKEREQYLAQKRKREGAHHDAPTGPRPEAVATCVHCQNAFGLNEGVVTDDVAICDVCLGD
jgi:hypothetical protein